MTRLFFFMAFVIGCQFQTVAQDNLEAINNYKYIIVPNKFDFQTHGGQYDLNELTKFLFNKYGYTAFLENEKFPDDLNSNVCLGLKAVVRNDQGGFLMTKVVIDLVDCKNQVVVTSRKGKSKLKEYGKAYNLALREAFVTYQFFDYSYNAPLAETSREKSQKTMPEPTVGSVDKSEKPQSKEVLGNGDIVPANVDTTTDILYAQPIANGFQIVDTEPKKVMILFYSGRADTFIVQGKDAIVYKKDNQWIYAENDGDNLIVKGLNLKF